MTPAVAAGPLSRRAAGAGGAASASSPASWRSRAGSAIGPGRVNLPLANAAEGKGLSKLWARRKIADAEVARTMRKLTAEEADKTILALALEHHLVTRLTSLVAVDKTPSRPDGEPLTRPTCR